ncbi:MAG: CBU_0592 family membrane protein [Flammeovirgaceae bacterium]
MMDFDLINIVGTIGLVEVLYAYGMLSMKKWNSDSLGYQLLNINGSVFLAMNAIAHKAIPLIALNAIWTLIGIITVVKILKNRNKASK